MKGRYIVSSVTKELYIHGSKFRCRCRKGFNTEADARDYIKTHREERTREYMYRITDKETKKIVYETPLMSL